MAPSRSPFRGQPVSRDELPMTLYHLTPEGPWVTLSYQLEGRQRRKGGKTNDTEKGRVEEEKNGTRGKRRHTEGLYGEARGGVI